MHPRFPPSEQPIKMLALSRQQTHRSASTRFVHDRYQDGKSEMSMKCVQGLLYLDGRPSDYQAKGSKDKWRFKEGKPRRAYFIGGSELHPSRRLSIHPSKREMSSDAKPAG